MAHHCCVVRIVYDDICIKPCTTVIGHQVFSYHMYRLGSVGEKVQFAVAHGGTQTQLAQFAYQVLGDCCNKHRTDDHKQLSDMIVVFLQMFQAQI